MSLTVLIRLTGHNYVSVPVMRTDRALLHTTTGQDGTSYERGTCLDDMVVH
jgi:hypothetical protein